MKKIKIITAVAFILGMAMMAKADVNTPYSMYGYGILGDRATSMQRQMGGVGYAMQSGRQINVMNPASYASIDSLTFLFDIGGDIAFLKSQEGSAKENSIGGGLDYVTLQFPIWKYLGASIGMLPYTSVGYAFGNKIPHGSSEIQGSGGINMAYLGLAGRIKGFSLGFNVSYNFGTIRNDVYSYPTASGTTLFEHVMEVRDWDINLGLQYNLRLNRFNNMVFGFTYSPKKSLHGKSWATTQETTQESKPSTVGELPLKDNYYTPNCFGAGISYKHEKISRFSVEFDFSYQQWADAKYSEMKQLPGPDDPKGENVIFQGMNFDNRMRFGAGAEIVPKLRGSYMERVAYRLGAYYCNDYLNIKGNQVHEYGVTCGFGFHAPQDKTMINVGFEWKHRSARPETLISENYFNITLGVNFNELWFWQRKIK